ncbi:MAG TPA: hypothetical protein VL689_10465 [Paraburkholderia sp.]|jgi:hypothetical protein|nr:hypothetical protein [Paraburkholderia sp.]
MLRSSSTAVSAACVAMRSISARSCSSLVRTLDSALATAFFTLPKSNSICETDADAAWPAPYEPWRPVLMPTCTAG